MDLVLLVGFSAVFRIVVGAAVERVSNLPHHRKSSDDGHPGPSTIDRNGPARDISASTRLVTVGSSGPDSWVDDHRDGDAEE